MLLLLILLFILMVAVTPAWPYSRAWGYYPTGGLGIALLIVVIIMLTGRV